MVLVNKELDQDSQTSDYSCIDYLDKENMIRLFYQHFCRFAAALEDVDAWDGRIGHLTAAEVIIYGRHVGVAAVDSQVVDGAVAVRNIEEYVVDRKCRAELGDFIRVHFLAGFGPALCGGGADRIFERECKYAVVDRR